MYTQMSFSAFKSAEKFFRKKDSSQYENYPSFLTLKESQEVLSKFGVSSFPLSEDFPNQTVYKFGKPEGLFIIKNHIPLKQQIKMVQSAMNKYTRKPHRTNLYIYEKDYKKDQNALHGSAKVYDISKTLFIHPFNFNKKIRWANLGYHYDWDHRCYHESMKSDIPLEMRSMIEK